MATGSCLNKVLQTGHRGKELHRHTAKRSIRVLVWQTQLFGELVSSSAFSKGVTALPQLLLLLLLATADRYLQTHTLISLELAKLLKLDPFKGMYNRGYS